VETVVKKCFLSEETKCREMYHEARTLQSVEMRKVLDCDARRRLNWRFADG